MKGIIKVAFLVLLLGFFAAAQQDDNWPSLPYLRNDFKSVSVVAHVRIREAEITGRVGGYENWKIVSEVVETFKGRFRKGDVIEYFHGAETGLKKEYFSGEKIVFLLGEHNQETKAVRYSVLENSTLPHTADRAKKLRILKRSYIRKHSRAVRRLPESSYS